MLKGHPWLCPSSGVHQNKNSLEANQCRSEALETVCSKLLKQSLVLLPEALVYGESGTALATSHIVSCLTPQQLPAIQTRDDERVFALSF